METENSKEIMRDVGQWAYELMSGTNGEQQRNFSPQEELNHSSMGYYPISNKS